MKLICRITVTILLNHSVEQPACWQGRSINRRSFLVRVFAIIPAGGKGKRSGTETPKQYLEFHGKELIVYTLEVFQKNNLVDEIIISAEPTYFSLLEEIKKKYNLTKISNIVEGGEERQDSVYNALKSIKANDDDLIAVHDAARPLLPDRYFNQSNKHCKRKRKCTCLSESKRYSC